LVTANVVADSNANNAPSTATPRLPRNLKA